MRRSPSSALADRPLLQRLRAGESTIGGWVALGGPRVAEVLARAGYDWVALDLEHTGIGVSDAADCIGAIRGAGGVPLVRLPAHDPVLAKRLLDADAEGLIVPDVRTVAQIDAMHAAMHYPPVGTRGVGLWRAQGWGDGFASYRTAWRERALLVIQLESRCAVQAAESLLAHPAVGAALIGPYDLSASLGHPGDLTHPEVVAAVARVRAVAAAAGVAVGVHVVEPEPDLLAAAITAGDRFVAFGTDFRLLLSGARRGLDAVRG